MYIIYCYRNKINDKKYIGITSRGMKNRERNHIYEAYNKNSKHYNYPFKQAIRKYGINNFENSILEQVETLEEAKEKEIYYIKFYNTYVYQKNSNGYNATRGGDNNGTILKPIVALDINTGEIIKEFLSIAEAEYTFNIHHISECLKEKLSTSGGYCWKYKEDVEKMSKKELFDFVNLINKRIVQLDMNNNFIKIWDSVTMAVKGLNLSTDSNIVSAYKGKRKSAFGYKWRTYYDYINNITPSFDKIIYYKKDINKNIIESYSTLREMAKNNNFIEQTLGRHLNQGLYKNFYWTKETLKEFSERKSM